MPAGNILDPFRDLGAAFDNLRLESGDTIYLRAGTHPLTRDITFDTNNVTIRPYTGEHAVIDMNGYDLTITGSSVQMRDLEIIDTSSARNALGVIEVHGPSFKLTNCLLHDFGQVGWWEQATNSEIYGCLFYNMGLQGSTLAHACYMQNTTGTKTFKNNIVMPTFSEYGIHAYAENGGLDGFDFDGIIHVGDYWLVGGGQAFNNIEVQNSITYKSDFRIGYLLAVENGSINIHDCNFAGYLQCLSIGTWTMQNNRFKAMSARSDRGILSINWNTGQTHSETIDNNIYEIPASSGTSYSVQGTGLTFTQWQGLGYDTNGTYTYSDTGTDLVIVQSNSYDNDRAHIAVRNWSQAASVDVNLSTLSLTNGRDYILRQAQDPLVDTVEFTYNSASPTLTIDMQAASHSVAIPTNQVSALFATTFPEFGAFTIEAA